MKSNLTELKKQYEALGEEIKKLEDSPFVPGWYMYWDNNKDVYHMEYVEKERVYKGACWHNIVPVTQEVLNKFLPKSTLYDWSDAPDWAQWAATDKDGRAFWYRRKPDICVVGECWQYISMCERAVETHPAVLRCVDWKDSLEQRPC